MRRLGSEFIGELSKSQLLRWQSGAPGSPQGILEELQQAREASNHGPQQDGGGTDTHRHDLSSIPIPPTNGPHRAEDQT